MASRYFVHKFETSYKHKIGGFMRKFGQSLIRLGGRVSGDCYTHDLSKILI